MDARKRQEMNSKKGVLTAAEVIRIRELLALGAHPKDLAEVYGVSTRTITSIRDRNTWSWLETAEHSESYVEELMKKPMSQEEEGAAQKLLEKLLQMRVEAQPQVKPVVSYMLPPAASALDMRTEEEKAAEKEQRELYEVGRLERMKAHEEAKARKAAETVAEYKAVGFEKELNELKGEGK
jgi:hypothetical protein